jgi:hypothetical protein
MCRQSIHLHHPVHYSSPLLLGGDVHSRERQRQPQLRNVVVVALGLGELELGLVGHGRWGHLAAQLVEVLSHPARISDA